MHQLLLTGFAAAALSSSSLAAAFAADLSPRLVQKAMPIAIAYDWTGMYVGVHVGWASSTRNFEQTSLLAGTAVINPGFTQHPDGFLGGAQIGFNRQTGNWVWGLEAELSASDLRKTTALVVPVIPLVTRSYGVSVDWTATLTGRLGYAWDRWMIYGKGGAAFMHETYAFTAPGLVTVPPNPPFDDARVSRLGWTLGAGVENAFLNNWSWKAEYNYLRFDGDDNISNVVAPSYNSGFQTRTAVDIHVAKAGINFRFGQASARAGLGNGPVYKATPIAIAYNWTGLYFGGHFGWAGADRNFLPNFGPLGAIFNPGFSQGTNGVIGGGQIGFNWQTGRWVVGLEADISGTNLGARTTAVDPLAIVSLTYDVKIDWTASLAGRVGCVWDRWMLYGKGGGALMRETYDLTAPLNSTFEEAKVTRLGWTLGAGVENAFRDNWSWKAEYNYMRFDDRNLANAIVASNAVGIAAETRLNLHAVKLGVNYRLSNN